MSECPDCAALHEELEKLRGLVKEGWSAYRTAAKELEQRRAWQDSKIEVLKIQPDDYVLFCCPYALDRKQMDELRAELRKKLPEAMRDRCFIISAGADLKVMPGPPKLHPPDCK